MNELDVTELIKAGRNLLAPFELKVQLESEDSADLRIKEILRLLPGRRIVAKAELKGRRYLVRLFQPGRDTAGLREYGQHRTGTAAG